ncbi:MAG: lamin tail domain-containing protein [Alcanivoracaceae bacterium]|nr:lamin tail domain-containing protein [Alcanivoracaceae bacterium]
MKIKFIIAFLALFPILSSADVGDLLITELVITPTAGEFIEIYNGGTTPVELTDVYITDATFSGGGIYYYQIVTGAGGGGGFADFHARFPTGANIAVGEYQTIALNGSADFINAYSVNPTYKISNDGIADGITPMLEARAASVDGNDSGLSSGEVLVLYSWDGVTDLVEDIDYVLWGDKVEAIDKTGVLIDSITDADAIPSNYLNDTSIASQAVISANSHVGGNSWQRGDFNEGIESQVGGNGIDGSDETSEDLNNTFLRRLLLQMQ